MLGQTPRFHLTPNQQGKTATDSRNPVFIGVESKPRMRLFIIYKIQFIKAQYLFKAVITTK